MLRTQRHEHLPLRKPLIEHLSSTTLAHGVSSHVGEKIFFYLPFQLLETVARAQRSPSPSLKRLFVTCNNLACMKKYRTNRQSRRTCSNPFVISRRFSGDPAPLMRIPQPRAQGGTACMYLAGPWSPRVLESEPKCVCD